MNTTHSNETRGVEYRVAATLFPGVSISRCTATAAVVEAVGVRVRRFETELGRQLSSAEVMAVWVEWTDRYVPYPAKLPHPFML